MTIRLMGPIGLNLSARGIGVPLWAFGPSKTWTWPYPHGQWIQCSVRAKMTADVVAPNISRQDRREWLDSGYDANFELTVDLNLDFISQNRPVQADVPIYGCSVHRWQDGNFCRRCGQRRQTSLSRAKNATAKAKAQREAAVDLNKKLCGVPQVSHQGTPMEVQKHRSPRVIQKQILCEARTLGVLRWHTMNPFMLWIAV